MLSLVEHKKSFITLGPSLMDLDNDDISERMFKKKKK